MQLNAYQQGRVERARQVLEASQNEKDADEYPRHLGRAEVMLSDLLILVDELTDGSDQ